MFWEGGGGTYLGQHAKNNISGKIPRSKNRTTESGDALKLLGIDKPDIMLPAVNSFHAQDCTEDFTPMVLVKDNWWFLLLEIVHEHYF